MSNAAAIIPEQEAKPVRACLRVAVDTASSPGLQALVGKLVGAFLESRWRWPRHFEKASPFAFLLTDPRASTLDLGELKHLARELQTKLFGIEGAGGVDLLVFQGDEVALHRFARLTPEDLAALIRGEGELEGELSRVGPEGVSPVTPPASAAAAAAPDGIEDALPDPEAGPTFEPCYRGVYFAPRQAFVSSLLVMKPFGATTARATFDRTEVIDGVAPETYDRAGIEVLSSAAAQAPRSGNVVTPLCFSALVRPRMRAEYAQWLAGLPAERRAHLCAAVYDTPRNPSYATLSQIVGELDAWFGQISLNVADPGFDVEHLPPGVNLVTYTVQGRDSGQRLAGIRRFAEHLPTFKRKRVWPSIDGLKTQAELEACLAKGLPLLSGPALCELLPRPVNGRVTPLAALPLRG